MRRLRVMWACALLAGSLVLPGHAQASADEVDITRVDVTAHDGISLGGWVGLPKGTPTNGSQKLPVWLVSSPYVDEVGIGSYRNPEDRRMDAALSGFWTDWDTDGSNADGALDVKGLSPGFPVIKLIRDQFAIVVFNVRGTGRSGGCFEFGGRNEQRDQVALVEWVARQPWSNGKVVMGGLSYMAFTAWQAAVQAPKPLVAIVTAGDLTDPSTFAYSFQGAMHTEASPYFSAFGSAYSLSPGLLGDKAATPVHACPDVFAQFATRPPTELITSVRDKTFWDERRLTGRLPNVRAAVLSAMGFWDEAHRLQDTVMWEQLKHAPKHLVRGWWGHNWPIKEEDALRTDDVPLSVLDTTWQDKTWGAIAQRWMRYWAKGIGTPGRIGVTDVVLEAGRSWTTRKGWDQQPQEVVYLRDGLLAPTPGGAAQTFLDTPDVRAQYSWGSGFNLPHPKLQPALCPSPDPATALTHAVYRTPKLARPVTLGGNPICGGLRGPSPPSLCPAYVHDVIPRKA